MSKYAVLDAAIIAAITAEQARMRHVLKPSTASSPLWDDAVRAIAETLAAETKRERLRIIDGRLQALRKAGRIAYLGKSQSSTGHEGWVVIPETKIIKRPEA